MSLVLPLHRVAIDPGRRTSVRLGMPHLTPNGLSETWLLRELGDVHWQFLAQKLGRPAAEIEDARGNRVYAAFRHVQVEGARFAEAREDESLDILSSIWRLSRTQVLSRHDLSIGGRPLGTVTMVSAFIRREGGSNHRVSRVEVPGLSELPAWGEPQPYSGKESATDVPDGGSFLFTPCPGEDFNGAGFLYFSSYVGITERAAWTLHPARARDAVTLERTIAYHGNIDMGEAVRVTMAEAPAVPGRWLTHAVLNRESDGACLARIKTLKQVASTDPTAGAS
ncbi:Pnap_2097 family protein [Aquabacter sp. CN5-332]|uniref:Pnap_2097 family protein n=1 Tax=Aquabacter sp. CN5-332 TaxID=3156608 RepID=UPI0032B50285